MQEAALALTDESWQSRTHLAIGRVLLADRSAQDVDNHLYEIVSHLNKAKGWITDVHERASLAELNLRAALRARNTTAFGLMADMLAHAHSLLPETSWRSHYALCYEVHCRRAEACYLVGDSTGAKAMLDQAMRNAADPIDKARAVVLAFNVMWASDI